MANKKLTKDKETEFESYFMGRHWNMYYNMYYNFTDNCYVVFLTKNVIFEATIV